MTDSFRQLKQPFVKKNIHRLLTLLVFCFSGFVANQAILKADTHTEKENALEWHQDYLKALALAKKTNKLVLADFTGTDWCIWCIRLKDEVFKKPEFKAYAKENLVLLEIDFPRNKRQPVNIKAQNKMLQKKYGIRGFPTILLLNSVGAEINRTGYKSGGPMNYIKHLEELRKAKPQAIAAANAPRANKQRPDAKALKKMGILELSGKDVADEDLARLESPENIKILLLARTEITDAALVHIAKLPNLEMLDLTRTKVTDKGVAHLKTMKKLAHVELEQCAVTDDALTHLTSLPLRKIILRKTQVTEDAIARFQKANPSIRIVTQ